MTPDASGVPPIGVGLGVYPGRDRTGGISQSSLLKAVNQLFFGTEAKVAYDVSFFVEGVSVCERV